MIKIWKFSYKLTFRKPLEGQLSALSCLKWMLLLPVEHSNIKTYKLSLSKVTIHNLRLWIDWTEIPWVKLQLSEKGTTCIFIISNEVSLSRQLRFPQCAQNCKGEMKMDSEYPGILGSMLFCRTLRNQVCRAAPGEERTWTYWMCTVHLKQLHWLAQSCGWCRAARRRNS